jgi:hypothetical protein
MLSPKMTGVEALGPVVAMDQATQFSGVNVEGRFFSAQKPLNWGPRHWGQLSA